MSEIYIPISLGLIYLHLQTSEMKPDVLRLVHGAEANFEGDVGVVHVYGLWHERGDVYPRRTVMWIGAGSRAACDDAISAFMIHHSSTSKEGNSCCRR